MTADFLVTFFPDEHAFQKSEGTFTLDTLADLIRDASAPAKENLRFLKLARFSGIRSPKRGNKGENHCAGTATLSASPAARGTMTANRYRSTKPWHLSKRPASPR
jgi:hypothetical protein